MTCIVGLVGTRGIEKGMVLLGGDCAGVVRGQEIYSLRNAKVFRKGVYVLGYTTSFRLGQIVRHGVELPDPPPAEPADEVILEAFLATTWVDALRQALRQHGFEPTLGEAGSLVVGVRGALFVIGKDFQVLAGRAPYVAVGSGRHLAYGALAALETAAPELPLETRGRIALEAAERFSPEVRGPFGWVEV